MGPSFRSNCRTHRLRVTLRVTPGSHGFGAEQTQQGKLTILSEGLFTEIAKKAFKRVRIATPPPCSNRGFSGATPPPGHGSGAPANSHRGWATRRRHDRRKL